MTDADRLDAIFTRLGDIERNSATAHAQIQGGIDVLTERVSGLSEKVAIQNGRVTKAEHRIGELETKARLAERDIQDDDTRHDVVAARIWAFVQGAALVGLGALLGHFL
jgi:chromosome segregation ATPase